MNKRIGSDDRYTDAPPEIARALAASEPVEDDFPSPEELARQLSRTITIRLDPAVYEWFRRPGSGYQTRINAVLRYYVRTQKAIAGYPEAGRAVSVARKQSPKGRANVRKVAAKRKHTAKR
jgi:uncharacterized protein (DUF4415 family)